MGKYYTVIWRSHYTDKKQYNYRLESNARKKFEEIAERIKSLWGYNNARICCEYPNDEIWTVTPNRVEYLSYDYDGCDDYNEYVAIKPVKYLFRKPLTKFED